ncbi:MAG: glycosyltransferase family 9 protein [Nanoarchaeota archaeon]|nr:glycosyltransferase family 9 protein [Nanoarchaeota archaeon]
METFTKKLANLFRILAWYRDYVLFKSIKLFTGTKKLPKNIQNILVIELLYIGDVIAITPTIRALKQKFPDAKIDVMLRPSMADVLTRNPNINKIITYDKQDFEQKFNAIVNEIKGKYDLAILFHPGVDIGNYKVSKLLKNAQIPFRIGCTKVGFLEGKGFFMHRKTKPTFRIKHKVEDNLDVIRTIGVNITDKHLELYITKQAEKYITNLLKKEKINKKDFLIAIHAAPQHKTHEWIPERFANVADELIKKYKAKIIFTGSQRDVEYNQGIISLMKGKAVDLAGKTDLKQFFASIKIANLVINVDTSAMHIAAAFNKPIIALFGAGNPRIWRPYCKKSIVIFKEKESCTSCMKHKCKKNYKCMKSITEKDVLNAVEKLNLS